MAVIAADLLSPRGRVERSFFPGDSEVTLEERLDSYIEEAEGLTSNEEAIKAWSYYRVYEAVADRLNSNPSTASLNDQGSRSYATSQIDAMERKAREWREKFDGLAYGSGREAGSRAVRTIIEW
jgi:hypothetical protein